MEETWHAARLIPTSGIKGAEEQERRGTSALLAVLGSVKEFGRTLTTRLGAPAGVIETYIEVPFEFRDTRLYPDGLIRVTRGARTWTCLVEVKTGRNDLEPVQLGNYLDIAKERGFDAVLTISNQIPNATGTHPCEVDKRKLRKVALHHLSWSQIHTEAILEKANRSVSDPEQAWILSELIRYLEHPNSGAVDFDDMGPHWVTIRDAVTDGTLRAGDKGLAEVCARFEQLLRYAGMQLGRQLGADVQPAVSRRELNDPTIRMSTLIEELRTQGTLSGGLRVPNTAGALNLTVDMRAGRMTAFVDLDAPRQGKPATRVNWLTRQLKDSTEPLRVDTFVLNGRGSSRSDLLAKVRADAGLLVEAPTKEIRSFRIALTKTMGTKRGQGKGAFVASVTDLVDTFYEQALGRLRPWSPTAPKLRHPDEEELHEAGVPADLVSTALSSQDEQPEVDSTLTGSFAESGEADT